MKAQVKINSVKTVNELHQDWTSADWKALLAKFDYPDADNAAENELEELVHMSITDFEPAEAAQVLLEYKLGDALSEGQIQNLSHEMLEDKASEEYPDTSLHHQLFSVNQLLFKSYNGKFPNAEATVISMDIVLSDNHEGPVSKEIALKALYHGLKENNLIERLYEDQINATIEFTDANHVLWDIKQTSGDTYEVITSHYWIEKDDIVNGEYSCDIKMFKEPEND